MSVFFAILAAILLIDVIWWIAADRLLRWAGWQGGTRPLHALFWAISAVYLWHLLVAPVLLPFVLIGGLLALAIWIYRNVRRNSVSRAAPESPLSDGDGINRRQFLTATAAFAPQILNLSLTGIALRQLQQFRIRRIIVPISALPPALDGATLAHVSDTHVGRFTSGQVLHRIRSTANELRADLVLLTGDLINGALHEIPEAVEMLRRLDARAGIFMIEGNHDLFEGRREFAEG